MARGERIFRCNDCGLTFPEDRECPSCGSNDVEEVEQCCDCNEWITVGTIYDDIYGSYPEKGICGDCLNDMATPDNVVEYGSSEFFGDKPQVSEFFRSLLDENEMNEIILNYLKEHETPESLQRLAREYIDDDPHAFADWLVESNKVGE